MLNIDLFFAKALQESDALREMVQDRIFNSARDKEADDKDLVPYLIVTYDGGNSGISTKTERVAPLARADVSIICCAETREDLAKMTDLVEETIEDAFDRYNSFDEHDWKFYICDADLEANGVEYDMMKPCYAQSLVYHCNTERKKAL